MGGGKPRKYAWGPQFALSFVNFRLWAPGIESLSLRLGSTDLAMAPGSGGWFDVEIEGHHFGKPYGFVLPEGRIIPDPASRCQLNDVSGPSVLVDPTGYEWREIRWTGRPWEEAIIYELHIGTFTKDGTFRAAAERLGLIADLGITAIEIMPLAHFPGSRGWGYDGVLHYAPHNSYGSPDDFKAFVDTAHGLGLMVFLDVVYNHFGPEGNFLAHYAPCFFHSDDATPWGPRIAFEEVAVRQYFKDNVLYWLDEFRLDGLRLDAVDQIIDNRNNHILKEISDAVLSCQFERHIHLITENPANGTDLLAQRNKRRLFCADWNDDFHHALHVVVTGENTGYYAPFKDASWTKLRTAMSSGYVRQPRQVLAGQPIEPEEVAPTSFVHFLQNHDQVGNRAKGDRLYSMVGEATFRLLTEILMLSPQIPLLFMGDDHLSSRPFRFFADYQGKHAQAIRERRPKEAENFGAGRQDVGPSTISDPIAVETFLECQLDWQEAFSSHRLRWREWLSRLIKIRHEAIIPRLSTASGHAGTVVDSPDRCLFIDWKLGDEQLQLRANLSDRLVEIDEMHAAQIYPATGRREGRKLSPMSLRVFITSLHAAAGKRA